MNKLRVLRSIVRKNVPLGLSAIAVVGVVATGYFAVKAGEKCSRKKAIESAKKDISNALKLDKKPIVESQHEWTAYAAPVIMGAGTIFCIVGAQANNYKRIAALTATVLASKKSLGAYKGKIQEIAGDDIYEKVCHSVIADEMPMQAPDNPNAPTRPDFDGFTDSSRILCYESAGKRYFYTTIDELHTAELNLNQQYTQDGVVSVNDFYRWLGLSQDKKYDGIGWYMEDEGTMFLPFSHYAALTPSGKPCYVVEFLSDPCADFLDYI
jgi:hypothetical protein